MTTQQQTTARRSANGTGNGKPQQAIVRATAPAGNAQQLRAFLEGQQGRLAEFAKGFMQPEAMIGLALIAMNKSPILAKCTMASILRALMEAAQVRIKPGGTNGRGYLVPRNVAVKGEDGSKRYEYQCFFDPGWRGLVDIARRSGELVMLDAQAVYAEDEFDYWHDPLPQLRHRPYRGGDRGELIAAYAVAKLKDGSIQIEVLERTDIEKIKKSSESAKKGFGPWSDWEGEMARKSAVRRLCKYLPVEGDETLERAMTLADSADAGEDLTVGVVEAAPQVTETRAPARELTDGGVDTADLDALEAEADALVEHRMREPGED